MQQEAQLEGYAKVQAMNTLRHKCVLLLRELCEKQIDDAPQIHEDPEMLSSFMALLKNLSDKVVVIIHKCAVIQFWTANVEPDQYSDILKIQAWECIQSLTTQIDQLTNDLNTQNLQPTFSLADLETEVGNFDSLLVKVQRIFENPSSEEVAQANEKGEEVQDCISWQRRKNLSEHVTKLKLRNAALQMATGVCFVSFYLRDHSEALQVQNKCKQIYKRLFDSVLKLDHIPNEEDGSDYLDAKLNTEVRLEQKLATFDELWQNEGKSDDEIA